MQTVQIIPWAYDSPVSGAELRTEAIRQSLQQIAPARQVAVEDMLFPEASPADRRIVAELVAGTPDVVIVEGVALLAWARLLRERLPETTRIVIDFHNVESALLEEQDRARLPALLRPLSPLFFGARWRKARRADREAIALADAVWTCSDRDAALARTIAGRDFACAVVPNAAPGWCAEAGEAPRQPMARAPKLLFLGHLGYPPNKVAVRRLAGRIMPAVQRRFPQAVLTVAGRAPNARLRRFLAGRSGVVLAADPREVAPLYADADLAVLPLSEGGGSRIKVLEALAVGCPVVGTAKAVEGIDLEAGRHFLRAETAEEFARAVARLAEEPALADRLRDEGRRFVRAVHSQETIAARVAEALAALRGSDTGAAHS